MRIQPCSTMALNSHAIEVTVDDRSTEQLVNTFSYSV
jgi:hypothetical protein